MGFVSPKTTVIEALAAGREVAKEHGFGSATVAGVQFWAHYTNENKWRVAFVRPSDQPKHGFECWLVLLDLTDKLASIQHGFDLAFPRTPGDPYRMPWPGRFEVSIDDAIRIAMNATSEGCFGPDQINDIGGVCFEQKPLDDDNAMPNQWHVVFDFQWTDGPMAGRDAACAFLIDIHTGARHLLCC